MRLLLLILFFTPTLLAAQQFTLDGQISDAKTGEKLMGVIIKNEATGSGIVSNMEGHFELPVSVGDTIECAYLGYKTLRYGIQSKDRGVAIELKLQSGANEFNVVVVSAGKFAQKVSEVTVSMEVLTPQLLHDKNVVSADEA